MLLTQASATITHGTVQLILSLDVRDEFGSTNYDLPMWVCVSKTPRTVSVVGWALFAHSFASLSPGTPAADVTVADQAASSGVLVRITASAREAQFFTQCPKKPLFLGRSYFEPI